MSKLNASIQAAANSKACFRWVLSKAEERGGLENELIRERIMQHVAQMSHLNGYDHFEILKLNGDVVVKGKWPEKNYCNVNVLWKPWKILLNGGEQKPKRREK